MGGKADGADKRDSELCHTVNVQLSQESAETAIHVGQAEKNIALPRIEEVAEEIATCTNRSSRVWDPGGRSRPAHRTHVRVTEQ